MAQDKTDKKGKKEGSQGNAVVLPNGTRRIDYIRDQYYDKGKTRSEIKNAINEMMKAAGQEDKTIPYQIVFAATKQKPEDFKKAQAEKKASAA